jgi:hypothetical protein
VADVLAHAGGVDEIILAIGLVMLFLLFRSSRAKRAAAEPEEGPCLYCGRHLGPAVERCPECGFGARRGPARINASGDSS